MLSPMTADTGTSDDPWTWRWAAREVHAALDAGEEAAAALGALAHESGWDAEGVRALHDLLLALRSRVEGELGALRLHAADLARAADLAGAA